MLRASDVTRLHWGTSSRRGTRRSPARRSSESIVRGRPHPEYAPWVARLQEFDPWRVTFAHDLAIWQREA
jgi:hypothetical protein